MTEPTDPLLKELAGDIVGVQLIDPMVLAPKEDPLEVKEPVKGPEVGRLNATHSTKAGGKGFALTVRGEYFAPAADGQGKKTKKNYEVVVNLPSLDAAMSVLKNKILDRVIKKQHPDAIHHRTLEIVQAVPLSPATTESSNLQYMNMDRLVRYVQDHGVPIDVKDYEDVVILRNTVIDFTLNPGGFEDREKLRQDDRKMTAEIEALNDAVPGL